MLPLTWWTWWIAGLALAILEVFAPGAVFMWLGVAAGLVGLVLLVLPGLDWHWQLILFAVLAVASVVVGRPIVRRRLMKSDHPTLNRRAEAHVGRTFTLDEPISGGRGRVKVEDATWKVEGPDLPAGARVRVTGADGATLRVEPAA
jgi:hypothetical protein